MTPQISRALARIVNAFDLSPSNQDFLASLVPAHAVTVADLPPGVRDMLAEAEQAGQAGKPGTFTHDEAVRVQGCLPPHVPVPKPGRCPKHGGGAVGKRVKKVAKAVAPNKDVRKAATGQAALDTIPLGSSSASMTSAERSSLVQYRGAQHFLAVNGSLRGTAPGTDVTRRIQADLDQIIGRSGVSGDVELWRGLHSGVQDMFADRLAGDLTGLEWEEKAYVSSSVRKSAAQEFTGSSDDAMLMRIRVPKGTGAVKTVDGEWDGEGEVILGRGRKMRIVADHGIDPGWGYRLVDVEVLA